MSHPTRSARLLALTTATALAATLTLTGAAPASAASTKVGNACVATDTESNATLLMTSPATGSTLPVAVPTAGVITKAEFLLPAFPGALPQKVKTFRPGGGANTFTVISETASLSVTGGATSFDVRVPVKAGDLIGVSGGDVVDCDATGGTVAGVMGDAPVGSTSAYVSAPNLAIPLTVTVEPDVDGDGFGDDTQDKCPTAATVQTACPTISAVAFGGPKSVTLVTTATAATTVSVSGSAKVKVKKAGKTKKVTVQLAGGAQAVAPGALVAVVVPYPSVLKKALKALPATKSVTITVIATTTTLPVSTTTSTVKVKGTRK